MNVQFWVGNGPIPQKYRDCMDTVKAIDPEDYQLIRIPYIGDLMNKSNILLVKDVVALRLATSNPDMRHYDCDVVANKQQEIDSYGKKPYFEFLRNDPDTGIFFVNGCCALFKKILETLIEYNVKLSFCLPYYFLKQFKDEVLQINPDTYVHHHYSSRSA